MVPWQASAIELAGLFDRKAISPVEVLETCLARHARLNSRLNAVVALDRDGARASAEKAEQRMLSGSRLGVLDGVPITIKDNIFVKGLKVTWGSPLYRDFHPPHDDIAVHRLRAAGAVILGKTNTPEFAMAAYTDNPLFGPTRNPWDLRVTPGGSSGGGVAALAAGIAPLTLGTDSGGSIRRPAAYTGVVGFKPSIGRIARYHGFPPIAGDLQVIAPAARTVADTKALYDIISGPDPRDRASMACESAEPPLSDSSSRLRICYVPQIEGMPVDPEIRAALAFTAQQLSKLGHIVEESASPYELAVIEGIWATLSATGLARVVLKHPDWKENVSPAIAAMCERGSRYTATDYVAALDALVKFRADFVEIFRETDVVLTPASASLAWPIQVPYPAQIDGQDAGPRDAAVFSTFVNVAGLPAISVPARTTATGLPIGIQLIATYGAENLLLTLAAELEAEEPWQARWPQIALEAA